MRRLTAYTSVVLIGLALLAWSNRKNQGSIPIKEQLNQDYERLLEAFDLSSKMKSYGVPGVSFAVIKNGELEWAKGYGLLQSGKAERVDTETVFSVGSVSKVGTAVICLKLHEKGKLQIDENVNRYLKTWKIPDNEHTKKAPVTLRHIMSHTGGLTVHGFADFDPDEELPTTSQILKGEWPAKNGRVFVNIPVGGRFRYSGGGTTIEQMVIEDLTGLPFHVAAKSLLFEELNMSRSSYENPLPETIGNIAKAHDRNGRPVALPRGYQSMPEAAASGLWTSPTDFSKLMIMLMNAYQGKPDYLSQQVVEDMMTRVKPSEYGLGPRISGHSDDIQFSHGGANDSYRAYFRASLNSQNGIIVFTNATNGDDLYRELIPVFEPLLFE